MQKIKKGGLWLVVAALILPNVFAYTIPYFNSNDIFTFYLENYLFVDFVLAWMLFGSIARIFVEKKFGSAGTPSTLGTHNTESPSIKPLYLSIGLILALGIVGLEMQYPGYNFLNSGIFSFILLIVLVGTGINELVRGEDKKISWAKILFGLATLILFLAWSFPTQLTSFSFSGFGSIGNFFGENWMNLLFILFVLIAIWLFISWLYKKGKAKLAGRNQETPPALEPDRITGSEAQHIGERNNQLPPHQGHEEQPPSRRGNQDTPRNVTEQLIRVRAAIETFLAYVRRIQTPEMIITLAQSQKLLELFRNARFEIRTLLNLRNYNSIIESDEEIFFDFLRMFANGIIISRGFTVI